MEDSKIFRVINRINAILFFLLLTAAIFLFLILTFQTTKWSNRGAVQVAENPEDKSSPKIELVLGSVNEIEGHEAQYVELRSKYRGGSFSSGYSGGETRNVLFLTGINMNTTWLFENHTNYIRRVLPIKTYDSATDSSEVVTIFYEFVDTDSNNNGKLDQDDLFSIALTRPNGSDFLVLENGIDSVIDRTLSSNGNILTVLFQKEGTVFLNNYYSKTFKLKNSASILEVSSGL